jgi:uncharacterized membrane protein YphA (DoxX/SURF4 family)
MNVVRMMGRACFAAFFVVDGLKVAQRPHAELAGVHPVMDTLVPLARRLAPEWVAQRLPDDAAVWARWIGTAEIAAGVCYGSGVLARPAAAVLCAASVPHVLAGLSGEDPQVRQQRLLHGLALLGGALVATQDKPHRRGIVSRGVHGAARLGKAELRLARQLACAAAPHCAAPARAFAGVAPHTVQAQP